MIEHAELVAAHRATYDGLCAAYRGRRQNYADSNRRTLGPFLRLLRRRFGGGCRVLEVGPGAGLDLAAVADEGHAATAVEVSEKMAAVAAEAAPGAEFLIGDFATVDVGVGAFHGAVARSVVHLFPRATGMRVLRKLRGALVPGGLAFVGTSVHPSSSEAFAEKRGYPGRFKRYRRRFTREELSDDLAEAGLVELESDLHEDPLRDWILWCNVVAERPMRGGR